MVIIFVAAQKFEKRDGKTMSKKREYSEMDLLKPHRRNPSSNPSRSLMQEVASDKARVLFSAPFRRMQQKAQVFPLESNTSVRSRMTHSLEVAHLGRSLSNVIATKLPVDNGFKEHLSEIAQLVETACLMHDIGNPPFGHFGEEAIRRWFDANGEDCAEQAVGKIRKKEKELLVQLMSDFRFFDGNCQGLRIVATIQWDRNEFAMNLTYPQVAAFLKYNRTSSESTKPDIPFSEKPGWFESEVPLVRDVKKELGIENTRHPLTYIMEAADDIAYCLSDIEDGIEKGIIEESHFWTLLRKEWRSLGRIETQQWLTPEDGVDAGGELKSFLLKKTSLTSKLVNAAADVFVREHDAILCGKLSVGLLEGDSEEALMLEALKRVAKKHIYTCRAAEAIEIAGYSVITGLLDCFRPMLSLSLNKMDAISQLSIESDTDGLERRLYNRLAPKYRQAYRYARDQLEVESNLAIREWWLRTHLLVDHIAGMTDQYALDCYQGLSGICITE